MLGNEFESFIFLKKKLEISDFVFWKKKKQKLMLKGSLIKFTVF